MYQVKARHSKWRSDIDCKIRRQYIAGIHSSVMSDQTVQSQALGASKAKASTNLSNASPNEPGGNAHPSSDSRIPSPLVNMSRKQVQSYMFYCPCALVPSLRPRYPAPEHRRQHRCTHTETWAGRSASQDLSIERHFFSKAACFKLSFKPSPAK